MGQISTLFVHKVIDATASVEDNERRLALFRSVGVDPEAAVDPKLMIPDSDYYSLCERVVREDPKGFAVTIRVGSSMRCDDYGAFGLAWKSATNLRGSYERAERYAKVLTSVSTYEVRSESGKNYMMLHRKGERLGLCLSNEQTIAAITQISREVCPEPFHPEAVFFQHAAPPDISFHEDYFGCPVIYEADRDALQVSEAMLQVPNQLGDARISDFFDTHMEKELAELADDSALEKRVRIQIAQRLSEGVPNVSDIAAQLGMSGRSLQRRLAERGFAYQDLVDESRRELAERLLKASDYALAEIAFMTGFSEQSAFTRAFKRWAGQTPRSFRLTVQS